MVSKTKAKKIHDKSLVVPSKRTIEDISFDDIDDEELSLTIETLQALSKMPVVLRGKRYKPLKAALHDVLRASAAGLQGSLTNRISDALTDARWLDARVLLAEFRIRQEAVKLGTLQRWVREVDAAAASTLDHSVSAEVFKTLDAILRATAPSSSSPKSSAIRDHSEMGNLRSALCSKMDSTSSDGLKEADQFGVICFTPTVAFSPVSGVNLYEEVLNGTIFEHHSKEDCQQNAYMVEVTPAAERKPPNQYDAKIYTTRQPLLTEEAPPNICGHHIRDVPGAFVIENLLSVDECRAIIRQGEAVSFSPDCAVAGSATQQASILAHNFYYFADQKTLEQVYQRALPFLPASIEGCHVRGINARFRVYRYVPGAVYRPHIDGSWPRSGLDKTKPDGSQYVYDDSSDGAQLSRLTFLIYLNDDFEEGYTTFFLPDPAEERLKGIRVEPRIGSVLVFPHGESVGALLHEGSAVTKGAKYVIRTDVLYDKSDVKK